MKTKLLLIGSLIAALLVLPYQPARAQQSDPKPQYLLEGICFMFVVGIGAVVWIEMHKMCKRAFPPPPCKCDGSDGCGCQHPPPGPEALYQATNSPPVAGAAMLLADDSGVAISDVSTNGWVDPVSGLPITTYLQTTLQSCNDLQHWAAEYELDLWSSDGGTLAVFSRAGTPVLTNYVAFGATNCLPLNIGSRSEPQKFYRLKAD